MGTERTRPEFDSRLVHAFASIPLLVFLWIVKYGPSFCSLSHLRAGWMACVDSCPTVPRGCFYRTQGLLQSPTLAQPAPDGGSRGIPDCCHTVGHAADTPARTSARIRAYAASLFPRTASVMRARDVPHRPTMCPIDPR